MRLIRTTGKISLELMKSHDPFKLQSRHCAIGDISDIDSKSSSSELLSGGSDQSNQTGWTVVQDIYDISFSYDSRRAIRNNRSGIALRNVINGYEKLEE